MLTANQIYRNWEVDGVPSSGDHAPALADIRAWGSWVEGFITAFSSNGGLIYSSLAALNADLAHAANSMAWVMGDPTAANNGIYGKVGSSGTGSWTRRGDLPFSFIVATDAGAGTANAIQATTSIPVTGSALIILNIFEPNGPGATTVSFNGSSPYTIKTNSGNDPVSGGLSAGMIVLGYLSGSTFRLASDQASAAIVAAAEDAADRAEAAEAAVTAIINGLVPTFDTVALASAFSPATAPTYLRTNGNRALADGGGALYKKVVSQPTHLGKFSITLQNASVVWYEVAESVVTPEMFGAWCDGAHDDQAAMQSAMTAWRHVRLTPGKTYYPRSMIQLGTDDSILESDGTATIFVDKTYFNNNNPYIAGDPRIAAVNAGSGGWALNSTGRYGTNAIVLLIGQQSTSAQRRNRIRVSGIRFVGDNSSGLVRTVIEIRNTRDVEVDHCEFTAFGMGICVLLAGTRGTKVHDNNFHDLLESGIYPAISAGDAADCAPNVTAIATTNDFQVNHGPNWKAKIYCNTIENVHFTGAGLARHGDQSDGINLTEMGQNTTFEIFNNHIESVAEGMDIFERYGVVNGNSIFNCVNFGLKFIYGAQFNVVTNNNVQLCGDACLVLSSPDTYETRNNLISNNIFYNADPTKGSTTDNGVVQLSSSGSGSTHSNEIVNNEYGPVNGKTIVRNTANVGSNPNNKVTGRVLSPGTHSDPKQRYCSQSWAGLDMRIQNDTFVNCTLPSAQNAAGPSGNTTIQFTDTAGRDDLGEYDNSAFKFTPLFPGYYHIEAQARLSGMTAGEACTLLLAKPSGGAKNAEAVARSDGAVVMSVSAVLYLTPVIGGTDDSIQAVITQAHASAVPISTGAGITNLQIRRV